VDRRIARRARRRNLRVMRRWDDGRFRAPTNLPASRPDRFGAAASRSRRPNQASTSASWRPAAPPRPPPSRAFTATIAPSEPVFHWRTPDWLRRSWHRAGATEMELGSDGRMTEPVACQRAAGDCSPRIARSWSYKSGRSVAMVFQTMAKSILKYPCASALRIS